MPQGNRRRLEHKFGSGHAGRVPYLVADLLQCRFAVLIRFVPYEVLQRAEMRGPKRGIGRHRYVWANASSLPVGAGDGIHRSSRGDPDSEMIGDAPEPSRMGATSRGVTHHLTPLLGLHIVGKFFGAGEGLIAGEHVYGAGQAIVSPPDWTGPELIPAALWPPVELVDQRVGRHEITADRGHHGRLTAAVPAHVYNQCVGVSEEVHCGDKGGVGVRRLEI